MQDNFELDGFLPYRISRLAEKVSSSLATVYASRFDISVAQWRILATLSAFPGASATFVAARCNLDKVKVSRAVYDLETREFVARRRQQQDGRASEMHLTLAGQRLFKEIAPLALEWEQDFLAALSQADRTQLSQLLSKLDCGVASADSRAEPLRQTGAQAL